MPMVYGSDRSCFGWFWTVSGNWAFCYGLSPMVATAALWDTIPTGGAMEHRRSALVIVTTICAMVVGTILWHFLKESYWAIAVDNYLEQIAHALGIERARIVATIGTIISFGLVVYAIGAVGYGVARWQDKHRPDFELIYEPSDPLWVVSEPNRTRYFVGLHILARRTVDFPNVWALPGTFTEAVFATIYPNHQSGAVQIYSGGAIDWGVTERFEMFGLPPSSKYLSRDSVLRMPHRFVLEIRGRNCQAVRTEFEYDPNKTPMIRKLSSP
jgi:hypothetical protein